MHFECIRMRTNAQSVFSNTVYYMNWGNGIRDRTKSYEIETKWIFLLDTT